MQNQQSCGIAAFFQNIETTFLRHKLLIFGWPSTVYFEEKQQPQGAEFCHLDILGTAEAGLIPNNKASEMEISIMDHLVFQKSPQVELGSNVFTNCPTVLQFDSEPLIKVIRTEDAGFSTEIPIYHSDGTYLAKVVGSRLFATADGEKAGVRLEHPNRMTVCKLGNQTLFEIRRQGPASLKTDAEIYTPTGYFVKYSSAIPSLLNPEGSELQLGSMIMSGCTINNSRIGIWMKSDGSVAIGCM